MSRIGDVVLVKFPFADGAIGKIRPAVVIGESENDNGDLRLAYITTQIERYRALPGTLTLSQDDLEIGTLKKESLVRLDKIALINQRWISSVGRLKAAKMSDAMV